MKKFFTLSLMAFALLAQAKVYTLPQLAELVPVMEDGTGVAILEDGSYVVNLPASLPDGVEGIGFDDNNIVLSKNYFTINGGLFSDDAGNASSFKRASNQVLVFSSFELRSIEVYDLQGRTLMSIPCEGHSAAFDVENWPKGMYVAVVRTGAGNFTKKLIVNQ